jgi:hypothetical protein
VSRPGFDGSSLVESGCGSWSEYSREFRERAVGLVFEQVSEHASECEAICAVASKLGVSGETLRSGCGRLLSYVGRTKF